MRTGLGNRSCGHRGGNVTRSSTDWRALVEPRTGQFSEGWYPPDQPLNCGDGSEMCASLTQRSDPEVPSFAKILGHGHTEVIPVAPGVRANDLTGRPASIPAPRFSSSRGQRLGGKGSRVAAPAQGGPPHDSAYGVTGSPAEPSGQDHTQGVRPPRGSGWRDPGSQHQIRSENLAWRHPQFRFRSLGIVTFPLPLPSEYGCQMPPQHHEGTNG